jgi:type I restriction enzyme S subunit
MGKWKEKKLSEVVDFSGGSQPPKSTFSKEKKEGYIRLIQIRDYKSENYLVYVKKSLAKKFCSIEDVMIGRYGPPVFQILKGLEGAYNVALMKAIPNEEILRKDYLFKFLNNPNIQSYIVSLSQRAAGQSGVNKKALQDYPILLPSLLEQQYIVNKLDNLFKKIDKAVSLLEANITHTKALMGSVLDEELSRFNTKTSKIKDVLSEINSGFACNKSNEIPDGYVHLRTHNIDVFGNLNFDKMIKINPNKVDQKKNKIRKNDILFNNTNSKELVGKTALVDKDYDYGYSNHLTRIRLNEDLVLPEFFVNYMINLHSQGYFLQICKKWIGQAGVNTGMLKDTEIKFPSIKNQIILNKKIDSIKVSSTELINQKTQKLTHLKSLKSSLLDQAFKGEF